MVEVKAKSIVLQPIGKFYKETGFMCGRATPNKEELRGEPETKLIQFYMGSDNEPYFYIKSRFGAFSLYDRGENGVYESHYA